MRCTLRVSLIAIRQKLRYNVRKGQVFRIPAGDASEQKRQVSKG